jgi:hypothetical protein
MKRDHSAWIITEAQKEDSGSVGVTGPRDITPDEQEALQARTLHILRSRDLYLIKFRLLDDDGDTIYIGFQILDVVHDPDAFWLAPLTDFGEPNWGCTHIEHLINGEWTLEVD